MELIAAGVALGKTYPAPIVVHEAARAKTLERFGTLQPARPRAARP
jgi:deoxyribodipyrimidine photo-lyase